MLGLPAVLGEDSTFVDIKGAGGDLAKSGDNLFVVVSQVNEGVHPFEKLFGSFCSHQDQREAIGDNFETIFNGNASHIDYPRVFDRTSIALIDELVKEVGR